ncbi:hypothetical protein A3D77_06860 [Candidatus Gottesmanbacteria bacterium RIFCSPHIGHO2_02_FULL_39_11]|uniref:Nudix hydrolase domain-containing protein n=1 Tax=Candidatus Gottesmanbacteria bacterium RIFCSPHIGHO2_02_FULL_39_11 TaxID=1798382 RepID=A0A1F5ZJS9_9BACT|nr:MAG: hypothetical protein A3D77_06860 [Candidatus Gottesmanbacteria bacterium RIFCSPHIGHO2_02_FULL_39_11]
MIAGVDYICVTTPFYCNDGKGNFVIHKRSNNTRDEKGRWDFGGGRVEFGEELESAAFREVREEYGVDGVIQEQLPAHSLLREVNGVKTHWIVVAFFIKVDISKVKNKETKKIEEIRISTLDNLPKPLHSGLKYSLKRYKKYFEKYKK